MKTRRERSHLHSRENRQSAYSALPIVAIVSRRMYLFNGRDCSSRIFDEYIREALRAGERRFGLGNERRLLEQKTGHEEFATDKPDVDRAISPGVHTAVRSHISRQDIRRHS